MPLYFKIESNQKQYLRFKIKNCKNKAITLSYHNDIALINRQAHKEIVKDYQHFFYSKIQSMVMFIKIEV